MLHARGRYLPNGIYHAAFNESADGVNVDCLDRNHTITISIKSQESKKGWIERTSGIRSC